MTFLVLSAALGCHQTGDDSATPEVEDTYAAETPLPYDPELDGDRPEPSLDGLAEAISAAAPVAYGLHAEPVIDAYDALLASGDEYCPQVYDKDGGALWYGGCAASSGTSYDGYGYYYGYDGLDSDGVIFTGAQLYGQMVVTDATGRVFEGDGVAMALHGITDDELGEVWYSQITGAFRWDGAATGTWLELGDSAGVTVYAADYADYGIRYIQYSGSVQIQQAQGLFAVAFDSEVGTLMETEGLGAKCADEPGGVLAVRDPNGIWYQVSFDGPIAGESDGDASRCDGCGDVSVGGESLGEICPDFSTWMDWETSPW